MSASLITSISVIMGLWVLTVMTPGPNFFATVHSAIRHGRVHGLATAGGIAAGTFLWATASLFGIAALFAAAGWLYGAVKLAGAAYLIVVGVQMWRAAGRPPESELEVTVAAPPPGAWRAFRFGLVTDLANPKAAVFFTSLFAVALPPAAPLWFHGVAVVLAVTIAGLWYGLAALVAQTSPARNAYRRAERGILRAAGAIFVLFGLKLATER